jgi:hypothetical protein
MTEANNVGELIQDLHRHAFDDCGGPPPQTHIAVQAANQLEAYQREVEARDELLERIRIIGANAHEYPSDRKVWVEMEAVARTLIKQDGR